MATGVIKSFKFDQGLVIVKLDGRSPDVALRVCGSDKRTVAMLTPGQKIRFDLSCARDGRIRDRCNPRHDPAARHRP
jgi:cold shock CspA family protein